MSKNVAVFVDVANIFYAAKAAGVDIDYVTLLKTASAGRDLVRAYAYTGLDPDNENQRNFHEFLRRHGYKVVSKDIRKYGDGKVKANLDIELVVDMMKTARNLDIAIVISGDGDFAPAIRAVQEMGVRVEVISFRGNTSSDLIEVADVFTEITQIAKVEKGSSRSGRRVADDEEDLSMTEVPDKQSEGTGRGRGRGRGRGKAAEAEPVVATRSRSRARPAPIESGAVAAITASGTPLVVLPGEKLSRVVAVAPVVDEAEAEAVEEADIEPVGEGGDEEPRRRRRRRGGRGRGRGRGQVEDTVGPDGTVVRSADDADAEADADDEELEAAEAAEAAGIRPARVPPPPKRVAQAFGSVWDSQIGVPPAAISSTPAIDDEDLDEPPIPEYLISERRQRDGRGGMGRGGGGGGRGVRGSYSAAVDRERYGGSRSGSGQPSGQPSSGRSGGSSGPSRYAEPAARGNRGDNRFRSDRPAPRPAPRSTSSDEPWSEVPPEIEAMLRAQLGSRPAPARRPAAEPRPAAESRPGAAVVEAASLDVTTGPGAEPPTTRRRTTRKPVAAPSAETAEAISPPEAAPVVAAPKRRATRRVADAPEVVATSAEPVAAATPRKRVTRKAAPVADAPAESVAAPAPKRRPTRQTAEPAG